MLLAAQAGDPGATSGSTSFTPDDPRLGAKRTTDFTDWEPLPQSKSLWD